MPRSARIVLPKTPHLITQRGNRGHDVFFRTDDKNWYLDWLREYAQKHEVEILAYCLLDNHIHLVAVPQHRKALAAFLNPVQMRYAQYVNKVKGWNGHLWQGRFFSCPLDEHFMWTAIRYVELNPVRCGLVERAESFHGSSAASHCGLRPDKVLTTHEAWQTHLGKISNWSTWLAEANDPQDEKLLRKSILRGIPCGEDAFFRRLQMRLTSPAIDPVSALNRIGDDRMADKNNHRNL